MTKFLNNIRCFSMNSLPSLTLVFAIFLSATPYGISGFSLLMPFIVQMVIYYWSVYRPQLLPYFMLLLLGLFKDIIDNNIIGMNALSFLLFQAIIISQRRFIINRAFIVVWAGFAFCLGVIISLPMLLGIYHYPVTILFSQWLVSIFAYVPMHWLLSKITFG